MIELEGEKVIDGYGLGRDVVMKEDVKERMGEEVGKEMEREVK